MPRTTGRALPVLRPYQVAGRIRAFKKPKSMVKGDIFPALVHKYAVLLAIPLADIFNEVTRTSIWPRVWKQEFVTVIPKCRSPASLGDLRNISCTMLPSKIYESYVLNWLSTEVQCKDNQYGGIKGCSVNHLLIDLWDEILWNLEDERAATMVTGIDYAKAFNRLSFQHCLRAFARKGASTATIRILASFLSNRTMSVRVGDTWSRPRPVYGGVPQGSILGVLLFNITTDDLEDTDHGDDRTFVSDRSSSEESVSSSLSSPFSPPNPDTGPIGDPEPEPDSSEITSEEEYVQPAWGEAYVSSGSFVRRSPLRVGRPDLESSAAESHPPRPASRPDPDSPAAGGHHPRPAGRPDPDSSDAGSPPPRPTFPAAESPPPDGREHDGLRSGGELEDSGGSFTGADAGPTSSTPVRTHSRGRPRCRESPLARRGPRLTVRDWSIMPGRTNRRRRRNLQRRINYTEEGEVLIAPEVNKKATGFRWKAKDARKLKYVDDGLIACKINMQTGEILSVRHNGKICKEKHDLITQNMFRRVVAKARDRGMVVNNSKTRIICVSDALTYKALSFIRDADDNKIASSDSMKILGFHMDSRPSCHAHIDALRSRMRETTWVLRHLKLSGFTEKELATVYTTIVRPVVDYCCVVYHAMLTDEQDQIVERLQSQALKNIYGYKVSYAKMREMAGVTTLRARRIQLCDKFAEKAAANPRFQRWFPPRAGRQGTRRGGEVYQEFTARTDRLQNSPLFYFRRRLNGKEGKKYGERNRKYRD